MAKLIITAGSITSAVRISKKLNLYGIVNTDVIHTPQKLNSGGCSYSVRCNFNELENILKILKSNKIKYKKLYREEETSEERNYYDIS